jgi:hypothetical protein
VTRKPTDKPVFKSAGDFQRFKSAMVQTARHQLFDTGASRAEAVEALEWFIVLRFTKRPHTEWIDPEAMVEECATEVKPLALECVLLAEKAGTQ